LFLNNGGKFENNSYQVLKTEGMTEEQFKMASGIKNIFETLVLADSLYLIDATNQQVVFEMLFKILAGDTKACAENPQQLSDAEKSLILKCDEAYNFCINVLEKEILEEKEM